MAAPEHPPDRALDVSESWALARDVDASKIAHARDAFRDLHLHPSSPRAESWADALAKLDVYADALVGLEMAQREHDLVAQLGAHLLLSAIGPGVAKRAGLLTVADYNRIVSS